jgi:hypothetical protein
MNGQGSRFKHIKIFMLSVSLSRAQSAQNTGFFFAQHLFFNGRSGNPTYTETITQDKRKLTPFVSNNRTSYLSVPYVPLVLALTKQRSEYIYNHNIHMFFLFRRMG